MRLYISSLLEQGFYTQLPQLFHFYPNAHLLTSYKYLEGSIRYENELDRLLANGVDVMIDSGLFTFLDAFNKGKKIDLPNFREYTRKYAHWLKKHKIEKFVEVDADPIIGYAKTMDLRKELEDITGKSSIVAYHPESRTQDDFLKSCETNKYVAYGTIFDPEHETASREMVVQSWIKVINLAHSMGCKIHGLAKTGYDAMSQCGWDSVDSASWTGVFRGQIIDKKDDPKLGPVIKTRKITDAEWSDVDKKRGVIKKSWSVARWIMLQKFADEQLDVKWPEMKDVPVKSLMHPDYEFPSYETVFKQMYDGQKMFGQHDFDED